VTSPRPSTLSPRPGTARSAPGCIACKHLDSTRSTSCCRHPSLPPGTDIYSARASRLDLARARGLLQDLPGEGARRASAVHRVLAGIPEPACGPGAALWERAY
jgi:hypothetical protein